MLFRDCSLSQKKRVFLFRIKKNVCARVHPKIGWALSICPAYDCNGRLEKIPFYARNAQRSRKRLKGS